MSDEMIEDPLLGHLQVIPKEEEPKKDESPKPLVAQRAKPRHSSPSMVENRLAHRQAGYDHAVQEYRLDTRAYHKPGSGNRHKM